MILPLCTQSRHPWSGENEEIFAGKEQSAINLAPWDIKDDLFHKYFLRN